MAKKTNTVIYHIKDTETGLYYTGGIYGYVKNPKFDNKTENPYFERDASGKAKINWEQAEDLGYFDKSRQWPWIQYYKEKWNEYGKIFTKIRGAEKALSELTRTSIHTRKSKAKNILFGNALSVRYVIVPCKIVDKVIKSKDNSKKESKDDKTSDN